MLVQPVEAVSGRNGKGLEKHSNSVHFKLSQREAEMPLPFS